jgi:hypothetical protein
MQGIRYCYFAQVYQKIKIDFTSFAKLTKQNAIKVLKVIYLWNFNTKLYRENLIESGSSSSDSDDKGKDPLKLMDSNKPGLKLMIFAKLKRMLTSYVDDKLKSVDKNLIKGIFVRRIKDFDEDFKDIFQGQSL